MSLDLCGLKFEEEFLISYCFSMIYLLSEIKNDVRNVLTMLFNSQPYTWTFNDLFATMGMEGYTTSSSAYWRVVNNSPGTSVVWDLV